MQLVKAVCLQQSCRVLEVLAEQECGALGVPVDARLEECPVFGCTVAVRFPLE